MPAPEDIRALRRDKYGDDPEADMSSDLVRLASGEPLAYVIGWVPFFGLKIRLASRPLIPRPETEWWTGKLVAHLKEKFGEREFSLLDLCAGSGAIGLAVLNAFPSARVTFGEIVSGHLALIRKNLETNNLDASRALIYESNLFSGMPDQEFDIIATNPPYIPESRELPESVRAYEPPEALFAGSDGLAVIRRIAQEAPRFLGPGGELWMECDSDHAKKAQGMLAESGARTVLHTDQYGRPRLLVSCW